MTAVSVIVVTIKYGDGERLNMTAVSVIVMTVKYESDLIVTKTTTIDNKK